MLDHFNLPVSDLERSRRFYEQVLATLDCRFVLQDGSAIGFGRDCWNFGIVLADIPLPRIHLAFTARDRQQVDRFYEAALGAAERVNEFETTAYEV
jgi:catechol 2,3-dioxygenase-like lactoylglutathione lyase family enzyme